MFKRGKQVFDRVNPVAKLIKPKPKPAPTPKSSRKSSKSSGGSGGGYVKPMVTTPEQRKEAAENFLRNVPPGIEPKTTEVVVEPIVKEPVVERGTRFNREGFVKQINQEILYAKNVEREIGSEPMVFDKDKHYVITLEGGREVTVKGGVAKKYFELKSKVQRAKVAGHIRRLEDMKSDVKSAKVGTYYTRTKTGYDIEWDVKKWEQAEDARAKREGDYGYFIGKGLSSVFSPERVEYAIESLRSGSYNPESGLTIGGSGRLYVGPDGSTYDMGGGKVEKLNPWRLGTDYSAIQRGHYEYRSAWHEGDWGKVSLRVVSSPMAMPFVATAAVKGGTLVARGIGHGFKSAVASSPKVYGHVTRAFPRVFDTTKLESGMVLQTKPASFVSRLGSSRFYQNIYGWSTNRLTRVRTLPMAGKPVTHPLGDGFYQTTTKYKGFGSPSWQPKSIAGQTSFGKSGSAVVTFEKSTYGHGLRSSSFFKNVSKPKGSLWWKRITVTDTSYVEFHQSPFSRPPTAFATDTWGGYIKPYASHTSTAATKSIGKDIIPNYTFIYASKTKPAFFSDVTASASLTRTVHHVPTHGGGMVRTGFISSLSAGSPHTITYPSAFTMPALSTVPVVATGFGIASLSLQRPIFKLHSMSIQKPGYRVSSVSASVLSQRYNQMLVSNQIQSSLVSSDIIQRQMQGQMQKQIQKPSLSYVSINKFKTPIVSFPIVTNVSHFKTKMPRPIILPGIDNSYKEPKTRRFLKYSKAYRFRDWKTIRVEDFLKGGKW